jgi:hypothetical protein
MIAARFRSLWWAAFAMLAGLGCYMVTQYVAGERLALEKVERRIRASRIAVRGLETELGTRASMSQLERWNVESLALRAPKPEQYLDGVQLASLSRGTVDAVQAPVTQVAYRPAPAAPAAAAPAAEPLLRQATYVRPKHDHAADHTEKVAMLTQREPLSSSTLVALDRIARTETSRADFAGQ